MQYLSSVQNLEFSVSSWFPHRFESEGHAIPWFCPKLRIFFKFGGISSSAKVWDIDLTLEAPRTIHATNASKRRTLWNFMLGHYNGLLEVMEGLSRSTACANAQAFPTDGANCKDSICNDPKTMLGSHVVRVLFFFFSTQAQGSWAK